MIDKTALSYWFPRLEAAGLPAPRTKILPMPETAREDIWALFDGKDLGAGAVEAFACQVQNAAAEFGYPFFLRTDHTSAKHDWKRTCFVQTPESVAAHIFALAEHSECCGMPGLPWDTWVVRELLLTKPLARIMHRRLAGVA